MRKENIISISAISLVALAAIGGLSFYASAASPGGFGRGMMGGKPSYENIPQAGTNRQAIQTQHDAVEKALEANDYNAWVAAIKQINANAPMMKIINAGNFSKLVEAHNYREKAHNIMQELGLQGQGMGAGFGRNGIGRGMGRMMGNW